MNTKHDNNASFDMSLHSIESGLHNVCRYLKLVLKQAYAKTMDRYNHSTRFLKETMVSDTGGMYYIHPRV